MKRMLSLNNKRFLPLHNFLAIVVMAIFGILAITFNWFEKFEAFIFLPLFCTFVLGKYIGAKEQEEES